MLKVSVDFIKKLHFTPHRFSLATTLDHLHSMMTLNYSMCLWSLVLLLLENQCDSPIIPCSKLKSDFYEKLLQTMTQVQKATQRLFALPGFSTLVECDTYLARYFQFETNIPSKMVCPRAYRNSLDKCKIWALKNCFKLTTDEMNWLKFKPKRVRRSNWMCHAGIFGLFRAIYKATGHRCETNHVKNLKSSLKQIVAAMGTTRHLIKTVDGKVVYLFKITDQMNTKLNELTSVVKSIDKTFSTWEIELNRFANKVNCDQYLNLAFLSKFATEINRAFAVIFEIFRNSRHHESVN